MKKLVSFFVVIVFIMTIMTSCVDWTEYPYGTWEGKNENISIKLIISKEAESIGYITIDYKQEEYFLGYRVSNLYFDKFDESSGGLVQIYDSKWDMSGEKLIVTFSNEYGTVDLLPVNNN